MEAEILENLKKAVKEYDPEAAAEWAGRAVQEKLDVNATLEALTEAIREVGDGFGRGELWLPDLVGAADALIAATPILEEELGKRGEKRKVLGTVVLGTVAGDIHDIGKTMVRTFLTAEGFDVVDLGVNVGADRFIEAVKEREPDILAMSALLTLTAPQQKAVIETLEAEGLRDKVKIMVGGAAVNTQFAEQIGADGYDPTAVGAVKLARRLIGA